MIPTHTGRIGDTPVIGAGTYASSHVAVSCTGHGEVFIKRAAAARVAVLVESLHVSAEEAVQTVLGSMSAGDGGIIAVGRAGDVTMQFNTGGMFRAVYSSSMALPKADIW